MLEAFRPPLGQRYPGALKFCDGPLRIQITTPFKPCLGVGPLRVVAERDEGQTTCWILAYEGYERLD